MSGVSDFQSWYSSARVTLASDPLVAFFKEVRNDSIHKGLNPLNQVAAEHLQEHLASQLTQVNWKHKPHVIILPDLGQQGSTILADAVYASETYFKSLLKIIFECYERFKCQVDPRWYFTRDNFLSMGRTFNDAVAELGYPSAWAEHAPEGEGRWRVLRQQHPPCQINDLFIEYLGVWINDPDGIEDRPEHIQTS